MIFYTIFDFNSVIVVCLILLRYSELQFDHKWRERSGHSVQANEPEIINQTRDLMIDDNPLKMRELVSAMDVSSEWIHQHENKFNISSRSRRKNSKTIKCQHRVIKKIMMTFFPLRKVWLLFCQILKH